MYYVIHWNDGATSVDTLDDANYVMVDIWKSHGDCPINVELLDDDNDPLSYWLFNMGDKLFPSSAP